MPHAAPLLTKRRKLNHPAHEQEHTPSSSTRGAGDGESDGSGYDTEEEQVSRAFRLAKAPDGIIQADPQVLGKTAGSVGRGSEQSSDGSGSGFDDEENDMNSGTDVESETEDLNPMQRYRQILRNTSFGALAEAQGQLRLSTGPSRAPLNDTATGSTDPERLQALRDRLADLQARKTSHTQPNRTTKSQPSTAKPTHRTSKHAPQALSSKYQVSRRRPVVTTTGHIFDAETTNAHGMGDPRFSAAAAGAPIDRDKLKRKYAFLQDYAGKELEEMKNVLGAAKKASKVSKAKGRIRPRGAVMGEEEMENLKVEIGRRDNRLREERRHEKEAKIRRAHKREERQKVKEGKKPYYLKSGEVREKVKTEIWDALKAKDRAKAEKRRQGRKEGKEKKLIPNERRSRVGTHV